MIRSTFLYRKSLSSYKPEISLGNCKSNLYKNLYFSLSLCIYIEKGRKKTLLTGHEVEHGLPFVLPVNAPHCGVWTWHPRDIALTGPALQLQGSLHSDPDIWKINDIFR
jgi:hypothetical protein